MALKISTDHANRLADRTSERLNNGWLRLYSGSAPATPDDALAGNTLLAELRFSNPASSGYGSGDIAAGVLTADPITEDAVANATGTATFYRLFESDGTTVVGQGSVGTSGADLNMGSVAIQSGAAVQITSFTHTVNKG